MILKDIMNFSACLEDVPCPNGCSSNDKILLTGHDLHHDLPGDFNVVICQSCKLIRTNPRPNPSAMSFYYPDDYSPYASGGDDQSTLQPINFFKKIFTPLVRHLFAFNTNILPPVKIGNMLEIGCASGDFLQRMAAIGWKVEGVEFSSMAASKAINKGFQVHVGSLETTPFPKQRLDLIVGWMVLEHLHDPIKALTNMQKWIKLDGYFVFSVPNAASFEFNLFGNKWDALQLPNHLYHFTPTTLRDILYTSGWQIEKIYYHRTFSSFIASLGCLLRARGYTNLGGRLINFPWSAGRWIYLLFPIAWIFSLFGQTGAMTVWARVRQ